MISRGEIVPGLWFTLWPKQASEEEAAAAKWGVSIRGPGLLERQDYPSTQFFCVEAVDLPLILAKRPDGGRTMLNIEGYDLREVKPEMLQAVLNVMQRGGAEPTPFEQLARKHDQLAEATLQGFEKLQKAIAAPPPPPKRPGFWSTAAGTVFWAVVVFAIIRLLAALFPVTPSAPAQPAPSVHESVRHA